jgi:hypothetical protein
VLGHQRRRGVQGRVADRAAASVGLTSQDAQTVRGANLVMEPTVWFVLVPLAPRFAADRACPVTGHHVGLVPALLVLFKLLITVVATSVLLTYMETFRSMAGVAADPTADLGVVRNPSPMLHAGAALMLLLVATTLAVYKPRGRTPYGHRKQHEQRALSQP